MVEFRLFLFASRYYFFLTLYIFLTSAASVTVNIYFVEYRMPRVFLVIFNATFFTALELHGIGILKEAISLYSKMIQSSLDG